MKGGKPISRAFIYVYESIRVKLSKCASWQAVREGAESTCTLREKHRSRGYKVLCLGKAEVINMLVWAHQCHLLGGKRLSGEFVFIGHGRCVW